MERYINIPGAHNIRDLGGYITEDGLKLKWGKIYRGGIMSNIDMNATDKMKALKLCSICDFRTIAEQNASPDKWYNLDQLKRYPLPIGEGRVDKLDRLTEDNFRPGNDHHLYKANRSYVRHEGDRYRAFFDIVLDESNYPILFHCTAGKDRTGFAAILLLTILGVDRETIVEDYLLTNKYTETFIKNNLMAISKNIGIKPESLVTIFQAKEDYIKGAFDAINEQYETMDNYLEKGLGITEIEKTKLKSILLESAQP